MNNEPVAWMKSNGEVSVTQGEAFCIPLYTHPAKTLTDEEIMEIFTAYEQMQEYGYVGKKPFEVHTGWNLSERNDCLMLARAILRKASEK